MSSSATATLAERYAQELRTRGYLADDAQRAALEALDRLRVRLLPKRGRSMRSRLRSSSTPGVDAATQGVYLYGGVGRGKTWLMDLLYQSLPDRAVRLHFHHFMQTVHAELHALRSRREPLAQVAKTLAAQADLLCLDELYVSDIADAMILGRLFAALLQHGMSLVITSNLAPHELYRAGLQRERFLPAIALLERTLEVCSLGGGQDYRLRQMQSVPIYLDSSAPDSAARLQRLFGELGAEVTADAAELTILGQQVPVLGRSGDVVWFSFEALCAGPRSQHDYIEIARRFRTVLLSDVPVFQLAEQDDAARRFIAVIDEFYDQGTKLVLSAAAPPAQLYRAQRLQAEFLRTASRLVEMQTESYLARARRQG